MVLFLFAAAAACSAALICAIAFDFCWLAAACAAAARCAAACCADCCAANLACSCRAAACCDAITLGSISGACLGGGAPYPTFDSLAAAAAFAAACSAALICAVAFAFCWLAACVDAAFAASIFF